MELFREALETHRQELNSLNVYPVPDGDTGTNMLLTQRAVTSALESSPPALDFENLAALVSRASLMGARGNSGVILSQILRGLCDAVGAKVDVGGKQLAAALEHATHGAYRAVAKPAEGTMLSVIRDATAAARAASTDDDGAVVVSAALRAARESLSRTRASNPPLEQAGVVDAGGKGLVLLLDALLAALTNEAMTEPVGPLGPVKTEVHDNAEPRASRLGYEVQFLLGASGDEVGPLREALASIGESVVVVGGGGLFNVHVHTDEPDSAVQAGERVGSVHDVTVAPLADQVRACIGGEARAVGDAARTSVVAVADGGGIVRVLGSLGALAAGAGNGAPPSVEELIAAIHRAPAEAVIVLPNSPAVITAAEHAAMGSSKRAVVLPTRSVPAGLSAAATFDPAAELEDNLRTMKEILAMVRSGEITLASEAEFSGRRMTSARWTGIVDEELVDTGPSLARTAMAVVKHLVHPETELLTLIVGASATAEDEQVVLDTIARMNPGLRIELVRGGQSRETFLIGVE